jgi:hypothetical protein
MTPYFGDFAEDASVYIPFNTFSSDDPSASVTITNLADADIKVHKDGAVAEIVTDGATIAIDFDGITGNHLITVDTSAHADYSTGSDYLVRIEGTTVDGATINAFVGSFSIENRYMRGTDSANTTTPPTAAAIVNEWETQSQADPTGFHVNVLEIGGTAQTANDNGADINAILVDTNSLNDTKIPDTISLANINVQVDTALSDIHLDHLFATDYDPASKPGTATALLNEMVESDAGVSRFTANALEQGPSGGGGTDVNVIEWGGVAIATPDTAGYPVVTVKDGTGTGEIATTAGAIDTVTTLTGHTAQTGDSFSRIGANGAGLSAVPYNSAWDAEIQSEVADALTAFFTSAAQLVDDIWDEVLTGATHNVTNSAGKRLRQIDAAFEVHSGTAQAGAAATITLDTGADGTNDNIYRGDRCVIVAGTGIGEHGIIVSYIARTRVATMSETWVVTPDNTSEFILVPADVDIETWNHSAVTGDGDWAALDTAVTGVKTVTDAIPDSGAMTSIAQATALATVDTEVGQIKTVTDAIPDSGAMTSIAQAAALTTVDNEVGAIQADLDNGTDGLGALKTLIDTVNTDLSNGTDGLGALKSLIDALNDISSANVLTQVNAALDTAISELSQAKPTATPSIRTGIMLLYMALRNKTTTDTSGGTDYLEIYNNAGAVIAKKTLTDDGSKYTEDQMATGP